jgi:hypothetical protein
LLPVRQVINKLPIAWWTMGMREEEEEEQQEGGGHDESNKTKSQLQ